MSLLPGGAAEGPDIVGDDAEDQRARVFEQKCH